VPASRVISNRPESEVSFPVTILFPGIVNICMLAAGRAKPETESVTLPLKINSFPDCAVRIDGANARIRKKAVIDLAKHFMAV
jgi:hypothetical protein